MFNPYILLAALAAFLMSGVGGYFKGYSDADQRSEIAQLQATLNGAYRDLDAQRVAAEQARLSAEENSRAAARYQEELDAYETELLARGEAGACALTADDIARLSKHGIGSDANASGR
jgi:uncharacterized protein HemX